MNSSIKPLLLVSIAFLFGCLPAGETKGPEKTAAIKNNKQAPHVSTPVKAVGYKPIFNGEDLSGWAGDTNFWRIEEGALTAESTEENPCKENTFLRWVDGEVDDFELKLEYRIQGGSSANSGIQFRSQVADNGHVIGYQADLDLAGKWLGACYDELGRGMLAARGVQQTWKSPKEHQKKIIGDAAELMKVVKPGQWNEYHIKAVGHEITISINGKVFSRVIDLDEKNRDFSGVLAMQLHSGPPMKIQFRNIRLKRLPLQGRKKIVFVAGKKSHGYFSHEHKAGCLLLAESLDGSTLPILTTVYSKGWPKDVTAFDNADTVVCYCDGGPRHYLNPHLEEFDAVMKRGTGLVCLHYAVETVIGAEGDHLIKWMGGYFEPNWSVNPHWTAQFESLPKHPICNGVKPFAINDEWYYHMRFAKGMQGVTPILTDMPTRETLTRKDGPHSGNPFVRDAVLNRKEKQHVAWAFERKGGGRGFGFTGGHYHQNWQHDDFRKIVLNAICWSAKLDVPKEGIKSPKPTLERLKENQDYPPKKGWQFQAPDVELKSVKQSTGENNTIENSSDTNTSSHDLQDALSQLEVADGLQVELFAGEPMLRNPTNMEIDSRGRVWVCEGVNYRKFRNKETPGNTEGDRIVILEDTDGDGKADKTKTFYQGHDIDSAHGICLLDNRVLISCGDQVFYLIDDNRDDKADRKEILFTGIGGAHHDHGIHAFVFGPDGKLYFNFGNNGGQVKDKNGKPIIDKMGNVVDSSRKPYQEGMVFRCNLDGSDFETLGWDFRNNWEVCVDSFGSLWQSDNDDDGNKGVRINFVMEYGNYGYKDEFTGAGWKVTRTGQHAEIPLRHFHQNDPGVVPNLLQTGAGSPTGILVYEGNLLPEIYRNQIIHTDAGPNIVRAYPVKSAGAGYFATIAPILEGVQDKWFRPSDACVAPDGSLFIADWYDPGVGGHRMGDDARGRIFRVAPKTSQYQIPKCNVTSIEGAIAALKSPNLATRYLGWAAMQKLESLAEQALVELYQSKNPRHKARALWAIGKLKIEKENKLKIIREALQDENSDIRITAIRLVRQLDEEISSKDVLDVINMHDESPAVRRELLVGLRELRKLPVAAEIWTELAMQHDGKDRWYLEAIGIAAEGRWNECLDVWLSRIKGKWNTAAGRDIIWRSRGDKTAELLAQIIRDPQTPSEELPRYFRSLDFAPNVNQKLLADLTFSPPESKDAKRVALISSEAIKRFKGNDFLKDEKYKAALNKMLDTQSETTIFLNLVDRFSLEDRYPELLDMAIKFSDQQLGVDAARILMLKEKWGILHNGLRQKETIKSAQLAQAIGLAQEGASTGMLSPVMEDKTISTDVRRAAIKGLGRSKAGTVLVAKFANAGKADEAIKHIIAAVLHASGNNNVKKIANKLYPLPPSKDAKPLPPLSKLAKRKGDWKNGRLVYHSHGTCAKCHQVNGMGKEVGPDLSEIGKKLSRQAMFESIIYPSAGISHNYETYTAVTADGISVSGLLVSKSDTEVSIKNAEGIIKTISQDDLDDLVKQQTSLMPADLQKVMTEKELIDVVEYLMTLKQKKKTK